MSRRGLEWVVLTTGDRPQQVAAALDSIAADGSAENSSILVLNGGDVPARAVELDSLVIRPGRNLGVPGGRDAGIGAAHGDVVAFVDDDAEVVDGTSDVVLDEFDADPALGAVAMRIIDERGDSDRHHNPRIGRRRSGERADVALFIGAGHALRSEAYRQVGGYFTDIVYGHEELELCWRLVDAGWTIRYLPDAVVFHPKIEIGRHPTGWEQTGRNRVRIARRTLPWLVALPHVTVWLVLGAIRAPGRAARRGYVRGWRDGWRQPVDRRPITWGGVWRLTRLGRPPVV